MGADRCFLLLTSLRHAPAYPTNASLFAIYWGKEFFRATAFCGAQGWLIRTPTDWLFQQFLALSFHNEQQDIQFDSRSLEDDQTLFDDVSPQAPPCA
jgi:hypothetical protein